METTKDVEIDGKRYRISRFTAKVGSSIAAQLMPKIMQCIDGQNLDVATIVKMLPTISESELSGIQDHCFTVCARYEENGAVTPVVLRPGVWGIKELEYDVVVVMALTINALIFNLSPFFVGGGLQIIIQSLAGSIQLISQP